jgi:Domain of unknown function (DUF397)
MSTKGNSMGERVWRRSSFSQGTNNTDCVEVAFTRQSRFLRDSKDPDGGNISLSPTAWDSFCSTISK